jgi:hypothetical protein
MALDDATLKEEALARFSETIAQMGRDLANWVPILRRLAEVEALRTLALGQCSEITGTTVRSVIAARRIRDDHFWPSMNEAAWSLLLELFANRLEGERRGVAGLSAATGLSFDACLHWIDWLAGRGVVFRNGQAEDEDAELVDLTDAGADRMHDYLLTALKLSPWVQ